MGKKSKQIFLTLCMTVFICLLTACGSQSSDTSLYLDPSLSGTISQVSEDLLGQICAFSPEDAPYIEDELRQQRQSVLADGVAAWVNVQGDTGDFVRAISSQVTMEDADTYICTIYAEFEKRNVEYRIYYTYVPETQGLAPSNMSFDPEYTLGEKMQKAFLNMVLGMGLVFVILIFLSFVIRCFKYIPVIQERFTGKKRLPEGTGASVAHADTSVITGARAQSRRTAPAPAEPEAKAEPEAEGFLDDNGITAVTGAPLAADDTQLAAVIAAAIAAYEDIPADGLKVRSIRRAAGSKWKNQ